MKIRVQEGQVHKQVLPVTVCSVNAQDKIDSISSTAYYVFWSSWADSCILIGAWEIAVTCASKQWKPNLRLPVPSLLAVTAEWVGSGDRR